MTSSSNGSQRLRSHIEQAARESPAKKRFQPREAPDDSDEEEDGDKLEEDATDETKEVAQVPYKWNRYSEVCEALQLKSRSC